MTSPLFALLIAAAAAWLACAPAGAAVTREQACAVTNSYFNTPALDGPEAWDWPPAAQSTIAAHRWHTVDETLFRACPSATIPVVGLAFSEDGSLAQITRSSYPLHEGLDSEGGSIDTCLLRRAPPGAPEPWEVVGCKLDMVS